jgi:hypothetical protein
VLDVIPLKLFTQEMCDLAMAISLRAIEGIPDEFISEEMLMLVACDAPLLLSDNFPKKFRNEAFINRLIAKYPDAERYVRKYLG